MQPEELSEIKPTENAIDEDTMANITATSMPPAPLQDNSMVIQQASDQPTRLTSADKPRLDDVEESALSKPALLPSSFAD